MPRPLLQLGVMELEDLFTRSRRDLQVLRNLEFELQNRQVPRAKDLLANVRTAIKAASATRTNLAAPLDQPSARVGQAGSDMFGVELVHRQEPKSQESVQEKSTARAVGELPAISLSDAYKALNVTPGSSWESIELARRQLVQRASPVVAIDEKRQQLQRDAERINAAYMVIALERVKCR